MSRNRLAWIALAAAEMAIGRGEGLGAAVPSERLTPRTIVALYDGRSEPVAWETPIHRMAEMPLNYLGFLVEYYDVQKGLPDLSRRTDVRGILTWFSDDRALNVKSYTDWLERLIQRGVRIVVIGDAGVGAGIQERSAEAAYLTKFWKLLGLEYRGEWRRNTYDARIRYKDPVLLDFERPLAGVLPPFELFRPIPGTTSHLTVGRGGGRWDQPSSLVITSATGGYVAPGYTHFYESGNNIQWYVNPFEFFRGALDADALPKPDPATLAGRRIFYSHIDGDGWRNLTEIPAYRRNGAYSAEVILREVLEKYPDLPVTVGPVAADLDRRLHGSPKLQHLARQIFALEHVEAGTHTYTHPLDWSFFEDYDPRKEKSYNSRAFREDPKVYNRPRSYGGKGFSLEYEILASARLIEQFTPPGKRVRIVQWSGDTRPFEAAIRMAREAGLRNINGGDSRMDGEYPSFVWVAPLGRRAGTEWQVYSSNSNENTYTDLWQDRYFGFQHLVWTLRNTESPLRLKPFNLYYHAYSGEKVASLNALLSNLRYARRQELTPIRTSEFAAIAEGFFRCRIAEIAPNQWRIQDAGALGTIRFDRKNVGVDFRRSEGVLGQRRIGGRLFVAIDNAQTAPVVAIEAARDDTEAPAAVRPYLVHSRWQVRNLRIAAEGESFEEFSFEARGFGPGEMDWKTPGTGRYEVFARGRRYTKQLVVQESAGRVRFTLPPDSGETVTVRVRRLFNQPVTAGARRQFPRRTAK